MSEKIASALDYHFDKHRIVFWYDDGGKLKDVYEAAMVQQELEVPDSLLPLIREHLPYFKNRYCWP